MALTILIFYCRVKYQILWKSWPVSNKISKLVESPASGMKIKIFYYISFFGTCDIKGGEGVEYGEGVRAFPSDISGVAAAVGATDLKKSKLSFQFHESEEVYRINYGKDSSKKVTNVFISDLKCFFWPRVFRTVSGR